MMGAKQLASVLASIVTLASLATAASIAVSAIAKPAATPTRIASGLNREGLAARDNRNFGAVPDTDAAIGPRHYLETVNSRVALFDARTLKLVRARDAYAFWGRSNRSGDIEDPQIVWDYGARRWYYAALFTGRSGNRVLLAWTKRGDPADLSRAWCRMSIPSGKFIDDFPHLGFSRNHILIGTNLFDLEKEFFTTRLWVVGKPSNGRNVCVRPHVTAFGSKAEPLHRADGNYAFTLIPVEQARTAGPGYVVSADCIYDPAPGNEEDACGTRDRQANQITVWHVDGPRDSPRLTRDGGIDIPLYRLPSNAPQRGARATLDPSDTRLYQAVLAPDPTRGLQEAIWTQHTVAGPGGRSEVRWYELDPQRLEVVRRGTIRSARDWVFSAAISPTARGDRAVVHYVVSGPGRLPVLRARSRGPRTPDSAMRGEVTVARSVSPYRCGFDPKKEACPWGDYAAATPDPWRGGLVWGSNELLGSPKQHGPLGSHWRTRNFAIRPG